ncbi:unnamed protein product [Rotaria sp. Silwood2]|nr:unnamed protein product [Rotaria sp. Silwood2]CAF2808157.1 unnamed protein product [Rotaria sp. Silwood2]CAF3080543.1 unnamed protein product [Rotaria sp. Silwood2]CAF3181494.1 unnamed protein product [Rotaria sp. Silwood2]CAF3925849.1 unnamed protein product [Rotaria sp. Silwood2]
MDSTGGYQLIGRTLPIWNIFIHNTAFEDDYPWLLRFFDQVRFYPVDKKELSIQRDAFREGRLSVCIVHGNVFNLGEYNAFLKRELKSIVNFTAWQTAAFAEEVSHWQLDNHDDRNDSSTNDHGIAEIQHVIYRQVSMTADICGSI